MARTRWLRQDGAEAGLPSPKPETGPVTLGHTCHFHQALPLLPSPSEDCGSSTTCGASKNINSTLDLRALRQDPNFDMNTCSRPMDSATVSRECVSQHNLCIWEARDGLLHLFAACSHEDREVDISVGVPIGVAYGGLAIYTTQSANHPTKIQIKRLRVVWAAPGICSILQVCPHVPCSNTTEKGADKIKFPSKHCAGHFSSLLRLCYFYNLVHLTADSCGDRLDD